MNTMMGGGGVNSDLSCVGIGIERSIILLTSNACRRSSIKSSASSIPTDKRTYGIKQ